MRCYLPFAAKLTPATERFSRIARLMGADCVSIPVALSSNNPIGDLEQVLTEDVVASIAICPDVAQAWLGTKEIPSALVSFITKRFRFALIHELDTDDASARLLRAFSHGILNKVREPENQASNYRVASMDLCREFSGLEFGPAGSADRILACDSDSPAIEPLIWIGAAPIFARLKDDQTELFFLGGIASGSAEFDTDLSDAKVAAYFREIVPLALFVRHAFRDGCWLPANAPGATLIIDDPPLWKRYGFLNYTKLLGLMDEFNFHTSIAFIPYYWKSTVASTVRKFRERPDRLSVCFHGNDHTAAEFASKDNRTLDDMLLTATARMDSFTRRTGISCDRVIVFPQGNFSRAAMDALNRHHFLAAVNSHHFPRGERTPLTLADLLQPAILSFDDFPLFLRRYVRELHAEDIAWNAFFGRPVLIVEHHEIFKDPSPLLELASKINNILPEVRWANLATVIENACFKRREPDGTFRILSYTSRAKIANPGPSQMICKPEWLAGGQGQASNSPVSFSIDAAGVNGDGTSPLNNFEVPPGSVGRIVRQRQSAPLTTVVVKQSVRNQVKIHVRRRLSEIRDNYLSKSPAVMSFVKQLRQLMG